MRLFKAIDVDMDAERARINKVFKGRRLKSLTRLYDLFEAGEFQKCLELASDEKAFPYNEKGEYPEVEHIGMAICDVLRDLRFYNYWTSEQLLKEAKEKLNENRS